MFNSTVNRKGYILLPSALGTKFLLVALKNKKKNINEIIFNPPTLKFFLKVFA